ncbi:NUDIX domain-containing protein [Hyphomicrobium sp.]|uniref:NUDIX domain-containing protein n=1 Tax=Hyphomicrobium sp. TaxID=82 RepID=UPI002D784120|nr:NUDIX domain-containing protein [Hyphomicrobium sp.]HET6389606.1 NUDIX domain-containing protein [Hyphomicrobium sp.]
MKTATSAGLLLYRDRSGLEVLLGHPGGPYWRRKDDGSWTVPKGEVQDREDLYKAALREFEEETGFHPEGPAMALGSIRQAGGKHVHAWAIHADWNPETLVSNTFSMEWPPRSGRMQSFPEIDRAEWFGLATARLKILKSQVEFLNRLEVLLQEKKTDIAPDEPSAIPSRSRKTQR